MFPRTTSLPTSTHLPTSPEDQEFQELYDFLEMHKAILRRHTKLPPELFAKEPFHVEQALRRFLHDFERTKKLNEKNDHIYHNVTALFSLKVAYAQALIPLCAGGDSSDHGLMPPADVQEALAQQFRQALSRPDLSLQSEVQAILGFYRQEAALDADPEVLEEDEFTEELLEAMRQGFDTTRDVLHFLRERLTQEHCRYINASYGSHLVPWEAVTDLLDAIAPRWWVCRVVERYEFSKLEVLLRHSDAPQNLPRPPQKQVAEAVIRKLLREQTRWYKGREALQSKGDDYFPFEADGSNPNTYAKSLSLAFLEENRVPCYVFSEN